MDMFSWDAFCELFFNDSMNVNGRKADKVSLRNLPSVKLGQR